MQIIHQPIRVHDTEFQPFEYFLDVFHHQIQRISEFWSVSLWHCFKVYDQQRGRDVILISKGRLIAAEIKSYFNAASFISRFHQSQCHCLYYEMFCWISRSRKLKQYAKSYHTECGLPFSHKQYRDKGDLWELSLNSHLLTMVLWIRGQQGNVNTTAYSPFTWHFVIGRENSHVRQSTLQIDKVTHSFNDHRNQGTVSIIGVPEIFVFDGKLIEWFPYCCLKCFKLFQIVAALIKCALLLNDGRNFWKKL
jgi:hypothetical protein